MSPRINGSEIPSKPAIAIGNFSSSVILSVLLYNKSESKNVCELSHFRCDGCNDLVSTRNRHKR